MTNQTKNTRTKNVTSIVSLTGVSRHTLDRIGVNLAKAGDITKSVGRGLHAKEITPGDVAKILIAMMAANVTSKSSEVVKRYSELRCGKNKFGDALESILSNYNLAQEVVAISAVRNYPEAIISWNDGSEGVFRADDSERPGMRVEVTLSGNEVISRLAWDLKQAKEYHSGKPGK